ncbi:MAG: mono/diheme cytochrome c family protein [Candidatus Poriferisodalaceae bacterium]
MTEVPDFLLERSRDRRRALGLLADDGGSDAGASSGGGPSAPAVASGPSTAELVAAAKAAAKATPAAEPEPEPDWVEAARTRHKIPMWVLPVLFCLPIWGFVYVKLTEPPPAGITATAEGATVYSANCASCHLGNGAGSDGGGNGRPLWEGEAVLTFPDLENGDMETWVSIGTDGTGPGTGYGDPNRAGGQHISGEGGVMPAFGEKLSEHQVYAVARYIREQLSGEEITPEQAADREAHWIDLGGGAAAAGGGGGH